MYTVTIGGCEIGLRCDINAYEEIVEKYGSIEEAVKVSDNTLDNIKRLKTLTVIFANEHNAFNGDSKRFTETEIGRMMRPGEQNTVYKKLIETINEAFAPKN